MKGYKRTSVILSETEYAAWKASGLSLQDLIRDGVAAAEADPAAFADARQPFRRNLAATDKPGVKVPVSLNLALVPRLEAVKAATGTGLPGLVAAGLEAAGDSRAREVVRQRMLDEALAPVLERLEALEKTLAGGGNGAKPHPAPPVAAVPFKAAP